MRRFFVLISAFCLCIMLSSCRKSLPLPENPDATMRLALRAGVYSDVIKKILRKFEFDNNVLCEVEELPEKDLYSKVFDDSKNPSGLYDFCMVDGSWMAQYAANSVLADLHDFGYELDADIIGATKKICYFGGGLYLAPFYGNVTVLLYNKLIVKEAGFTPDKILTLEDMEKICRFSKSRHNLGFMYRGDTQNNIVVDFLPILRSCGAWVVDENNRPSVNTPEFKEAMSFYLDLIETGRAAKKDDLIAAVANKSAAMAVGWPGWYTPTRNSCMDYKAITGRRANGKNTYNANIYGVWAIGIPANSSHKEYSMKLLKYLMDPAVQKTTIEIGGVPCRFSCLSDPAVIKKYPQYVAVRNALDNGIYRPVMEEWPQFYTILGNEMDLIIKKEKSVDEGLDSAQNQLDKLLGEK